MISQGGSGDPATAQRQASMATPVVMIDRDLVNHGEQQTVTFASDRRCSYKQHEQSSLLARWGCHQG